MLKLHFQYLRLRLKKEQNKKIKEKERKWKFSGEKMCGKKKRRKRDRYKLDEQQKRKQMEEWKMRQEWRIFSMGQEYLIKKHEIGPKCLIEKTVRGKVQLHQNFMGFAIINFPLDYITEPEKPRCSAHFAWLTWHHSLVECIQKSAIAFWVNWWNHLRFGCVCFLQLLKDEKNRWDV